MGYLFDERLREVTSFADRTVKRFLPEESGPQGKIMEAMNYSLTAGGKRLRPILMWETYRMCGGEGGDDIEAFMAAVEMIHTYSLVHDDLPAMDNDVERRGKETTWHAYGEAMGILAGDGLLNYAFETALGPLRACSRADGETPEGKAARMGRMLEALWVLAGKAGIHGMIGGQVVDVAAQEKESEDVREEQLLFIHEHKTAALIQAAMMAGAILAGASGEQVAAIERCACNVGIAFQIQDDILDVVGNRDELGKPIGSDAQNNKKTYVTLKGLDEARRDVEAMSREAAEVLDGFGGEDKFLKELILELIHRRA